MKICPNCNNQFDDAVAFCDKCGTPLAAAAPAQPVYTQPAAPAQPVYTQPAAPAPKKKMPTWVPIAIIAAILVIVGIVVGVIFLTKDKDDKDDGEAKTKVESSTEVQNNDPTVPNNQVTPNGPSNNVTPIVPNTPSGGNVAFTVGNIQGNKYANEWAGFSFAIPAGWEAELEGEEFTAVGDAAKGETVVISYAQFSDGETYDDLLTAMEEEVKTQYSRFDYDYYSSSKTIAGRNYDSFTVTINESGVSLVQCYCCTQIDDYAILILISATDEATVNSIINSFAAV